MEKRRIIWYLLTVNLIVMIFGVHMILFFAQSFLMLTSSENISIYVVGYLSGLVLSIIHFVMHFLFIPNFKSKEDNGIDLDKKWKVDAAQFYSKGRNCPYDGWELQGKAVMTMVGGCIVMKDDQIIKTKEDFEKAFS